MSLFFFVPMVLLSVLCAYLLERVTKNFWVGLVAGVAGVFLFGVLVTQLQWFEWLELNVPPLEAGSRYLGLHWEFGLLGGVIGAGLSWVQRWLRRRTRDQAASQPAPPEALQKKRD